MAIVKKISELTPKGSALANTDLLIVGVDNGTDYDLKSVTGAQVLGNVVSQTITDGVTTKSPSENAVFDALALKVDKVTGSRLITSAEATILGNTSGTNTGDQNLQQVTDKGAITTNTFSSQNATFQSSLAPSQIQSQRLSNSKRSSLNADGYISFSTTGISEATIKATNILNDVTLEVPNKSVGSYTIATISDLTNQVPYTGATTNVNLGEFELKAGQLSLDITPTGTAAVGTTRWNDALGSSETTLKGGSVIIKNGVDLVARVVNKVTPNTTLTKASYQVVKVSGAQGQRLAVNLAQANNDNNSADTLGIVCETIPTNQEGFIITVGQLENVNTTGSLQSETWVDGDVLYLSPTTAGKITNIKPTGATGHIVILGYVEYAHAVNGKIYVKIMNGWELDELHNVSISNPLDKQLLSYENSTSLWKNKSVTTADIADSTNKRYVTDANLTTIGNTSGTNTGDQILSDATLTTTDITTNNVSTTKHGFAPKAPNNTTQFLRGDGTWATPAAGGLTFFTEAQSTAAPNATVNVDSLTAVASTTDADFSIIAKGTGAILASIPNNIATVPNVGGNKRGQYALDLQHFGQINVGTEVASGNYSSITAGNRNTASGQYSFIGSGFRNTASNDYSVINSGQINNANGLYSFIGTGQSNTASSTYDTVLNGFGNTSSGGYSLSGGLQCTNTGARALVYGENNTVSGRSAASINQENTASSDYSNARGLRATTFTTWGKWVLGGGGATLGSAQKGMLVLSVRTTNNTPTEISFGANGVDARANLTCQDNNGMRVKGSIIAKQSGSTNIAAWDFDYVIVRGVGVGTTSVVVSNVNVVTNIPVWGTPTITADTVRGYASIKVIGVTANIQWTATIESTEVIYA